MKGEVSNCKYHSSGHIYFTLKENNSAISAIMFAGNRGGLSFRMQDGDKVEVTGSIEVFERDGRYQIYAKEITLAGAGDLYARFLQLKQELEEMGMFAEEYKKPIPQYAGRIGIVKMCIRDSFYIDKLTKIKAAGMAEETTEQEPFSDVKYLSDNIYAECEG